jgi:hypothetical protein
LFASAQRASAQSELRCLRSRKDVVNQISAHIFVALATKQPSEPERTAIVSAVKHELEAQAPSILPERLEAPSERIMDLATSETMPIEFDDADYLRARTRSWLYSVQVRINYLKANPPMDSAKKLSITLTVDSLLSDIRARMELELIPLRIPAISKEAIDGAANAVRDDLDRHVGPPFGAQLWTPLSDADSGAFAEDFSRRLRGSLELIKQQAETGASYANAQPENSQSSRIIFASILSPVRRFVALHTTDQARSTADFTVYAVPGWQASMDDNARVAKHLFDIATTQPGPVN